MHSTFPNKTVIVPSIGIMSALPEEADSILNAMKEKTTVTVGIREFVLGFFEQIPVVFSLSGIGKVSAAVTATLLIERFEVSEIIFTGVAGGGNTTAIGDIVIGSTYVQHDLDLTPICPSFYISSLDKKILHADEKRVFLMKTAANHFLNTGVCFPGLGIDKPKVHEGVIVSGDQFIHNLEHHKAIVNKTKELLPNGFQAIEMEGASVAQACKELEIPFVVLRTISDKADEKASVDFPLFLDKVARHYSLGILKEYVRLIRNDRLEKGDINLDSPSIDVG